MRAYGLWAGVVAGVLLLAGCGTDGPTPAAGAAAPGSEPAASAADDEAAIREVVDLWGAADTPEEMCAVMSEGLKSVFDAVDDCVPALAQAIEDDRLHPEEAELTIADVQIRAPLAVAVVDVGPPYVLLVKNLDDWRVDGQTDKEHLPQAHAALLDGS